MTSGAAEEYDGFDRMCQDIKTLKAEAREQRIRKRGGEEDMLLLR